MNTVMQPARLDPNQLKALSERRNLPGVARAIVHFSAIGLMSYLIWHTKTRYGSLYAAPFLVVQGYLVAFLFTAVHECAHKTAFESRSLSLLVGNLAAFLVVLPYEYYSAFHWDHHRYTQDPEKDPELVTAMKTDTPLKTAFAYTGFYQLINRSRLYFRHAVTGRVKAPWVREKQRGMIVREARAYVLGYLALLALSIALDTTILVWTWVMPLFIGQLFLRPYLYTEHTGCAHSRNALENTRTTYTNPLVRWFAWNMPYHVEHHAHPSVPFHALPKLNRMVAPHIVHSTKGYFAAVGETWRALHMAKAIRS